AAKLPGALWFRSLALFASMGLHLLRKSEVMIGSVISSVASASWSKAIELLDLAVSRRLASLIACSSALSGENAAQWQSSFHVFGQMSQLQFSPDEMCLGALVSACDKGGAWHLALHSLRSFARHRLGKDILTWNSAISACERRRRWPHALALLAVQPTADRAVDGVTAACSACGKGGLWERALSLSQSLPQADPVLHNTLVFACVRGTAVAHALRLRRATKASDADLLLAMYETLQDTSGCLHLFQGLRTAVLADCRGKKLIAESLCAADAEFPSFHQGGVGGF
ncbi:unnamed protein product, partial [Cladocopium goreaui]